jgi:hypothetical protein
MAPRMYILSHQAYVLNSETNFELPNCGSDSSADEDSSLPDFHTLPTDTQTLTFRNIAVPSSSMSSGSNFLALLRLQD